MGQTADQLRHEIDDKREDAAAKIDEIEARVQNSAQLARETVSETVTETMDTVAETVETVQQNFDLNKQVQERPLMMLGAAVLGGFVLGGFVLGGAIGGEKRHRRERYQAPSHTGPGPVQKAVHNAGLDTTMSAVTGALVGMAADRLRRMLDESFPEFGQRLRQEMTPSSATSRTGHRPGAGSYPADSYTEGAEIPRRPEDAYREPLR